VRQERAERRGKKKKMLSMRKNEKASRKTKRHNNMGAVPRGGGD
jgi:hypothetical protein